jgi:hypothetical protein
MHADQRRLKEEACTSNRIFHLRSSAFICGSISLFGIMSRRGIVSDLGAMEF